MSLTGIVAYVRELNNGKEPSSMSRYILRAV